MLRELVEIGHVVLSEKYFLHAFVLSEGEPPETLVFLDCEAEATQGDASALTALIAETKRRAQWAHRHVARFPIAWIADHRAEWDAKFREFLEVAAQSFLQQRPALWRAALADGLPPLVAAVARRLETGDGFRDARPIDWTARQTLAWLRRMAEETYGATEVAGWDDAGWRACVRRFAVQERETRLELKARALEFLHAYVVRLTRETLASLELDAVSSLAELRLRLAADAPSALRRPSPPAHLPQYTFMEARSLAAAIADGPLRRRWRASPTDFSLRHAAPNKPLQITLSPGAAARAETDLHATQSWLQRTLDDFNLSAVLLLNIALGWILQKPDQPVWLDDLVKAVGWKPRTTEERTAMRKRIWNWLQAFDAMTVHGKRPGRYLDPRTKRPLDLASEDALIRITGRRYDAASPDDPPIEVSWTAGPWLEKFRGNYRILQYFGDIQRIAGVPSGKPSGAWAQSVGLALNQFWRERAKLAAVRRIGERADEDKPAKRLTAEFPLFTRFELLNEFRCEPWVEDLLASDKPGRARQYWDEAIRKLKKAGVVGHYQDKGAPPASRRGWSEAWLHGRRLDIRPREDAAVAIATIAKAVRRARE